MAKVQFGSGVAYMSGRVAGTVYSRNKGGSYCRRFSVPVNAATTFQQGVRNSLAAASSAWRDLSAPDQQAWVAWAATHPVVDRLGAAILLSGQQAFVQANRNAFSAGLGVPFFTAPPAEPSYEFPFESPFLVTMDASAQTLLIGQTVQPTANQTLLVFASPAVSPGKTNVAAIGKFLGPISVLAATAVPVDVDISSMWVDRFGSIDTGLIGKRVVVSLRTYSNGQLSGAVASSGICVA